MGKSTVRSARADDVEKCNNKRFTTKTGIAIATTLNKSGNKKTRTYYLAVQESSEYDTVEKTRDERVRQLNRAISRLNHAINNRSKFRRRLTNQDLIDRFIRESERILKL